jgi:hypothetical protein
MLASLTGTTHHLGSGVGAGHFLQMSEN